MANHLIQLVYFSRISDRYEGIDPILESSIANNSNNFISGALMAHQGNFIQVLEGGRSVVSETYHRICADNRHEEIILVGCKNIELRSFPEWSMAMVLDTPNNRSKIFQFSSEDRLEPDALTQESLVQLMLACKLGGATKPYPV